MIFNMNAGANQVQVIDFTVSEDINLSQSESLVIDDVNLPNGTFSRFDIIPLDNNSISNNDIERLFNQRNIKNVTQCELWGVVYTTVSSYHFVNGGIAEYDDTNKQFKLGGYGVNLYLRARDYRLVIW